MKGISTCLYVLLVAVCLLVCKYVFIYGISQSLSFYTNSSCQYVPIERTDGVCTESLITKFMYSPEYGGCIEVDPNCWEAPWPEFSTAADCYDMCGGVIPAKLFVNPDISRRSVMTDTDNLIVGTHSTTTDEPVLQPIDRFEGTNVCTGEPFVSDIGKNIFPTSEIYRHVGGSLGELFTASDCSQERVALQWGVYDGMFTLGSHLTLRGAPSGGMIDLLEDIGYACDQNVSKENCAVWMLTEEVLVEKIVQLREFINEIQSNDCINCG